MASLILVHGAMHGAWCWERIVPILRHAGHYVQAVNLPGSDRGLPADQVDLHSYTRTVVEALVAAPGPAALVGHSMGGLPISTAAEARPDLITALIYLCAVVPVNGKSLLETSANPAAQAHFRSDDDGISTYFPAEIARDFFFADCTAADGEAGMRRLTPQPTRPLKEPVRLSADRFGRIAKHYVLTGKDRAISPEIQMSYTALLGDVRLHSLESGHSPFYSQPTQLANLLGSIAAEHTFQSV
jgi:pimeloyl-ACP methyl ester carboxylesterase